MRFFNLKQHCEPRSMFVGNQLIYANELVDLYGVTEIKESDANRKPQFGSGNISVNEKGEWKWIKTNHNTSD